jgi:phosphoglucomutase
MIAEMAAYYRSIGSSVIVALNDIYAKFGYFLNKVDSYEFEGLAGMETMKNIMQGMRENPPVSLGGMEVVVREDFNSLTKLNVATGETETINLPKANILIYWLAGGHQVIVRPSGTEPKVKVYYSIKGKDLSEASAIKAKIDEDVKPLLK